MHTESSLRETPRAPKPAGFSYKVVMGAVLIAAATQGLLSVTLLGQAGGAVNDAMAMASGPSDLGTERQDGFVDLVSTQADRVLEALASQRDWVAARIDQGLDGLRAERVEVSQALAAVTEGVQSIREAVADLGAGNEDLGRRLNESRSRLDSVAKDVRALHVAKRQPTAKPPPAASTPPFQIDGIDRWDDGTYVAVSREGRVAFLKEGEPQSGWAVTRIDRLQGQVGFRGPAGQAYTASVRK